jgi:hypothetical protein
MSIPVTASAAEAFDRVRPVVDDDATDSVASVGEVADETVTSEGRCPR